MHGVSKREFLSRLKSSNDLFLHNSTQNKHEYFVGRGRPAILYDFFLSDQDRKSISEAENALQRKVKKVARDHKDALNSMLGRLNDRYDVEFSTLHLSMSRRMPIIINLRDKNVEVPLINWGSGTQNRTHILLSILQANRIKTRELRDNRITPIVLIEEPESFLHPSAQSEFGTVLQRLSEELAIQIIASTHSPFMLNQNDPDSTILLKRRVRREKQLETYPEETSGEDWMKPFADHLGIIPEEFRSWRDVIGTTKGAGFACGR
jgi:putative ATP-dependent endonuclease of the OLD family